MSDVTLSASVRQSLLSLQSTTSLIERTQNRLSTGLRVSSAIDDPVAFFQGESLSDRATDFREKKDAIDQGISTITAAVDGVEAIENLVRQMKGISNSMKSATDSQISDLVSQFNDLRSQIDNLAADATYQGTNLINGSGQTLSVEFSEKSASLLNINSIDIRSSTAGLNVAANSYYTGDDSVEHAAITHSTQVTSFDGFKSAGSTFSLTFKASNATFSAGETVSFTFGTGSTFNFRVATGQALTLTKDSNVTVTVVTSTTAIAATGLGLVADVDNINGVFTYSAIQATTQTTGLASTALITYAGTTTVTVSSADSITFRLGSADTSLQFAQGLTLTAGAVLTINILATGASTTQVTAAAYAVLGSGLSTSGYTGFTAATTASYSGATAIRGVNLNTSQITANGGEISFTGLVKAGDTTKINAVIDQLDAALITLRTRSQTLGSNVALLNARLDFTENYANTLQGGADKLVLADINSEGANLLALQTRQQLGIQSLSLAAQAEASILSLFG